MAPNVMRRPCFADTTKRDKRLPLDGSTMWRGRAVARAFAIAAAVALALTACAPGATGAPDERSGATGQEGPAGEEADAPRAHEDAADRGTVWIGPNDLAPLDSDTNYLRNKEELVVMSSSGFGCFGTRLRLPDGATITELAAISYAADAEDASAETFLQRSPWDERSSEDLAATAAATGDHQETVTTDGTLPVTVATDEFAYRVMVCLQGHSGFLSARVAYDLP